MTKPMIFIHSIPSSELSLKYRIIFFILLCFTLISFSQQLVINGKIVDNLSIPLSGVEVFLSDYKNGTVTNTEGEFIFELSKNNNNDTIVINSIGYIKKQFIVKEILKKVPLLIVLEKEIESLNEVSLVFNKNIFSEFSSHEMSQIEIFTNASSNGDVLNSLQNMSVSTNTEESARLNLRGSNYIRNRVYFNNVPLYRVTKGGHLDNSIASFSIFNTSVVKKIKVYGSTPPISFTNTSGGVINVLSKEQGKNLLNISLTFAGSGLFFSKTINKDSYIQVFSNYTDLSFLKSLNKESLQTIDEYNNFDFGVNTKLKFNENIDFKILSQYTGEYGDYSSNILGFYGKYKNTSNRSVNVLNMILKNKKDQFIFNNGLTYSDSSSRYGNLNLIQKDLFLYTGLVWKKYISSKIRFELGFDSEHIHSTQKGTVPLLYYSYFPNSPTQKINSVSKLNYLDVKSYFLFKVNKQLSFGIGYKENLYLNINNSHLNGYQINSRYLNNNHKFSLGYGKYYSFNIVNLFNDKLDILTSNQLTFQYNYYSSFIDFGVVGFAKNEKGNSSLLFNNGSLENNDIFGFEIEFKKNLGKGIQLKISNIYLNSKIDFNKEQFNNYNNLDFFLKANISIELGKNLSSNLSWSSRPGLLYTPIEYITYNEANSIYEPHFSSRIYSESYNNYNILNINFTKQFKYSNMSSIFFVGINNLLNTKNQRNLIYNSDFTIKDYEYYSRRTIFAGVVFNLDASKVLNFFDK